MKKVSIIAAMMLTALSMNAQSENGNCGVLVVPAIYDNVSVANDGLFIVMQGKKKGVVDSNGKMIVPIQYDDITLGENGKDCGGLIVVRNNLKRKTDYDDKSCIVGLYNKDGVMIAPMDKYEDIGIGKHDFGYEGLIFVKILQEVIKEREDYIGSNDYIEYERHITKDGILLKNGTLQTFDDRVSIEKGGLIIVNDENGLKGVLDKNGKVIIPCKYDDVSMRMGNGLIAVTTPMQKENGKYVHKYGVYNDKGQVVVPVGKYERIDIEHKYIIVKNGTKKGILNINGTQIVPIGLYEDCSEAECDDRGVYYVSISSHGKKGVVNDAGKVTVPIGKYERAIVLNKDLISVLQNGKSGILDKNGVMIVPIGKYEQLAYRYGVLTYCKNGKWGILDQKGNQATPAEYDKIEPARHSNGMALVTKDGMVGVLNSQGKQIIALGSYLDGALYGKIGFLKSNEGTVIFDLEGKILAPLGKYEKCMQQYGNLNGTSINHWPIPINPTNSEAGVYLVENNGKYGVIKLW